MPKIACYCTSADWSFSFRCLTRNISLGNSRSLYLTLISIFITLDSSELKFAKFRWNSLHSKRTVIRTYYSTFERIHVAAEFSWIEFPLGSPICKPSSERSRSPIFVHVTRGRKRYYRASDSKCCFVTSRRIKISKFVSFLIDAYETDQSLVRMFIILGFILQGRPTIRPEISNYFPKN